MRWLISSPPPILSIAEEEINAYNDTAAKRFIMDIFDKYFAEIIDEMLSRIGVHLANLGYGFIDVLAVIAKIVLILNIYLLILGYKGKVKLLYYSAMAYTTLTLLNVWLR